MNRLPKQFSLLFVFFLFLRSAEGLDQISCLNEDIDSVLLYRNGLADVVRFLETRHDFFPQKKEQLFLNSDQKDDVRNAWKSFLDHILALDSIKQKHKNFFVGEEDSRAHSFLASYSALLSQYRFALEFISLSEKNRDFSVILNEPVHQIGLPENSYDSIKFRFLNLAKASEFAAMEGLFKKFGCDRQASRICSRLEEDREFVWKTARWKGKAMTAANAVNILKKAGFSAWFPVQSGVAEFMGDVKVHRVHTSLVTDTQIRQMVRLLEPGDILLERREWYLSNIGLPGFWPHAALYVGTPEERRRYFETDPDTAQWIVSEGKPEGDLETLLKSKYPSAYAQTVEMENARVLEAISEGVSFTTIEHSAAADSIAVLRPKLPKKEKAIAIVRAFAYVGRPYDFNFDFRTDSALVCTELIYKAYEPYQNYKGLTLPLIEIIGRKATPPNEIVRLFDETYGDPEAQFDFVIFLDGNERNRTADFAPVEEFRRSWKRPKWHIFTN